METLLIPYHLSVCFLVYSENRAKQKQDAGAILAVAWFRCFGRLSVFKTGWDYAAGAFASAIFL